MNQLNLFQGIQRLTFILLAVLCFGISTGQTPEEILKPRTGKQALVTDFTNTLTPDQIQALESKLVRLDDSTSTQVSVVIVSTTGGRGISEFNQELGRAWGVGDKRFNNGVVLLIAKADRKLDIAVGYGLEGVLTDYTSQHIIDDVIVPNFKGDDYYRGIDEGTDAILKAVKGEYNAPRTKKKGGSPYGFIIVIIIIIVILSASSGGNRGGGTFMSRRGSRG
ncbi:MAG: TPM domain-containing protein, partial [Chitinophagaceae bacterium]